MPAKKKPAPKPKAKPVKRAGRDAGGGNGRQKSRK